MSMSKSSKDAPTSKSGSKLEGKIQIQLHYFMAFETCTFRNSAELYCPTKKTYVLCLQGHLGRDHVQPCESGRRGTRTLPGPPIPMLNKPRSTVGKVPSFLPQHLGVSPHATSSSSSRTGSGRALQGRCTVPPPPHCLHTSSQLCQQDKPCYPRGFWGPPRPKDQKCTLISLILHNRTPIGFI